MTKKIQKSKLYFPILVIFLVVVLSGVILSRSKNESAEAENKNSLAENHIQEIKNHENLYEDNTPDYVEPEINNNILTTPLIVRNDKPQVIQFYTLPGWEFKEYSFQRCDNKDVCEYNLNILNNSNIEYNLNFTYRDIEFNGCVYESNKLNSEKVYEVYIPEFKTVQAGYGLLRIGRAYYTSNGEQQSYIATCQSDVSFLRDYTNDWVGITEIGYINIKIPENYDERLYNEMLKMISKVRNTYVDATPTEH